MPDTKTDIEPRRQKTRDRVLAAAERLLEGGGYDFSMRDLAAEAGVSFATPFNQFGGKAAIFRALSARRIDAMHSRFIATRQADVVIERVLTAVEIASAVMLEAPAVNRAVMGELGAPADDDGKVWHRSRTLWATALGEGKGLSNDTVKLALAVLPDQLAFAFRGVLSFWTAGEVADSVLPNQAAAAAATALLAFVDSGGRPQLERLLSDRLETRAE